MKHLPARRTALTASFAGLALVLAGCSAGGGTTAPAEGATLVVDNTFDLATADPARAFELTGTIVSKALYETALTFEGGDVTEPVPQLTTYEMSEDDTTITLTLEGEHTFSSGNPVTIDDIVWSYQRVQGIAGNPSFLLSNLSTGEPFVIEKTSDTTMTITDTQPNPALPYILPNPSLGVLDSVLLQQNGGTTGDDDAAEEYLNGTSAGSGPYRLDSYNATTRVVFTANEEYQGDVPAYGRVVLQNVEGPSQRINVQGGETQLALNLNSQQVEGLAAGEIQVADSTSANVGYLWLNQDPEVSAGVTDDPDLGRAMRHAIDYAAILELAGEGSTQPGGIIPSQFVGSLESDETNTTDPAAAETDLAASDYDGETIQLSYPTDATLDGVDFGNMAQSIQADLDAVGITVELNGLPIDTLLDQYRAGELQAGLMYWGPDFPDPSDYLTFSPGEPLGLRAGWSESLAPEVTEAKEAAIAAEGTEARTTAYQEWQRASNANGAFVPLLQAAKYVVTNGVSAESNPIWTVDLAAVE